MAKSKKKYRIKLTKGENLLIFGSIILTIGVVLIQVFYGALEGNLNMDVERLRYEITSQEKTVESLSMQVSELTSYDKIKDIVKGMGLTYKYENIVVVNK